MRTCLFCVALTLVLSCAAVGSANEPGLVQPNVQGPGVIVVPYAMQPAPYGYGSQAVPPRQVVYVEGRSDTDTRVPRWRWMLNRHGMSCNATHDDLQCMNFWSDFRFAFGSCRTFFGQGCEPLPRHHHKLYPTRP